MSNNEDRKLTKPEYFDLRERRLKLVYKILYVIVAIWITVLLSVAQNTLEKSAIPIYSFMLSASSMVIIQILKYTIMEFKCMKIIGHLSEDLMKQTEFQYDNIWKSFSLILSLCGLALIPHYIFAEQVDASIFIIVFSVGIAYFTVISFIKLFKQELNDKWIRLIDATEIIVGSVATYALCSAACLITSTT